MSSINALRSPKRYKKSSHFCFTVSEENTVGKYPEYHTSADDLDFIEEAALDDSFDSVLTALRKLESDRYFRNTKPFAEPQLGRRGLYDFQLEGEELQRVRLALLWVLNLSDGSWSLEDIARRAEVPLESVETAAEALLGAGILESA